MSESATRRAALGLGVGVLLSAGGGSCFYLHAPPAERANRRAWLSRPK